MNEQTHWRRVEDGLPEQDTPVLAVVSGDIRLLEVREERPTFEESFKPYLYWEDPHNEGIDVEWHQVTHWMPLPDVPKAINADEKRPTTAKRTNVRNVAGSADLGVVETHYDGNQKMWVTRTEDEEGWYIGETLTAITREGAESNHADKIRELKSIEEVAK